VQSVVASRASESAGAVSVPAETSHVDDEADDEGAGEESDVRSSYARKPLPPVKTTRAGRMFSWHRSHSVDNIPHATAAAAAAAVDKSSAFTDAKVTNAKLKTPTNSKGTPGTSRHSNCSDSRHRRRRCPTPNYTSLRAV